MSFPRSSEGRAERAVWALSRHRFGAFDYITKAAGDRPRTAFVRDFLAKDAALAKLLGA